jgi:hypothetical protein
MNNLKKGAYLDMNKKIGPKSIFFLIKPQPSTSIQEKSLQNVINQRS